LKFQAVAEKTTKDARGLLYFAAPGSWVSSQNSPSSADESTSHTADRSRQN